MATWISLLRGINVSGKNKIKMAALKSLYERHGFRDVRYYLQSGNVVFSSSQDDPQRIAEAISSYLRDDFGLEVVVLVIEPAALKAILHDSPFRDDPSKGEAFQYITFLIKDPGENDISGIKNAATGEEEIFVRKTAVYLYCPGGYGRTKLSNTFLEKKLGVPATTRNMHTVTNILNLSQAG